MNPFKAVQLLAALALEKHDNALFEVAFSLFYRRQP